jgi:CheY-like chemotaxis protein
MALVLVVEDEFAIAELLQAMIEDEGHAVVTAGNGAGGLKAMAASRPDLVITDTMMPGMGGPEMVRAMASVPDLSRLKIVVMSAMPEEMVGCDYPGYAAFLQKPFRLTEVAALLSRLLSQG